MVQTTVPSLLILGTDAVLGASPATAVQLAHACLAAGYHAVIPASWGDELIAARALQRLSIADAPRVMCSCPLVSRRLADHGEALSSMLLHLVAPPVATAQYLRAAYAPVRPHVTYVGSCPSALDESIDVWLTSDALLRDLVEKGIVLREQPTEFDSVIPPDRRRFFSDPGGTPSRQALLQLSTPVDFVELRGEDVVLALGQQLLSGSRMLVDVSVALGCSCSGRTATAIADGARARVLEQEPPRAFAPIVDHSLPVILDAALPMPVADAASSERSVAQLAVRAIDPGVSRTAMVVESALPRRSPAGVTRPVNGAMPVRRVDAGRQLPRAFVARRRATPRGLHQSVYAGRSEVLGTRTRWVWVAATSLAVGVALALLLWRP